MQETFGKWVNPSIASGGDGFADHARFLGYTVTLSALIFGSLPVLFATGSFGSGSRLLLLASAFLLIVSATVTSRKAWLQRGKSLALLALAFLLLPASLFAGGIAGLALLLFCVVPIEAVVWQIRRPVIVGTAVAVTALAAAAATGTLTSIQINGEIGASAGFVAFALCSLVYAGFVSRRIESARQKIESQLLQERSKLELIANNTSDLVIRQTVDGKTLFASAAARRLFGTSSSELLGTGLIERIHLQDRVVYLRALSQAARAQEPQHCTLRIRCKGGDSRIWGHFVVVCRGGGDAVTGQAEIVCTITDKSDLIAVREQLELSITASNENHEARRRFLATMSHELRTPLNAIVGFSDILKQELFGKLPFERHREYAELIQHSGQHLLSVVNDLLDMSRIDSGKYELSVSTFPLQSVVETTVKMLGNLADKSKVAIHCAIDPDLPDILADRRACQQILINLVSNAIKFSPDKGQVRVSAKQFGRSVKIIVQDNGVGIDPDFIPSLGQPFMQADAGHDRKFEGSGLGLFVVKGLIALHQGELQIHSVVGKGTKVSVILPLRVATSNPVPADQKDSLVFLDQKAGAEACGEPSPSVTVSKGDRRARVSA